DGVRFTVEVAGENDTRKVFDRLVDPKHRAGDRPWQDVSILLGNLRRDRDRIILRTCLGPKRSFDWTASGWADPLLSPESSPPTARRPRGIDMTRSAAYAAGETELGVFFNCDPLPYATIHGERESEELRRRLSAELLAETLPDGTPIFHSILPRQAVHRGPHVERAPHLLLRPRRYLVIPDDRHAEAIIEPARLRTGTHRSFGVFIAWGRDIQPGRIAGLTLADLAPTILAYLLQVRTESDGGIARGLFTPGIIPEHLAMAVEPPAPDAGMLDPVAGGELERRLSDLGYL
ncbi:hypothetical protein JW905_14415, partial [bacterium]|nr:hypothetical protein [candidate division CSSED10-310 bacterium]